MILYLFFAMLLFNAFYISMEKIITKLLLKVLNYTLSFFSIKNTITGINSIYFVRSNWKSSIVVICLNIYMFKLLLSKIQCRVPSYVSTALLSILPLLPHLIQREGPEASLLCNWGKWSRNVWVFANATLLDNDGFTISVLCVL